MCVLWTILWESKELWMLFPSHWASLWYDSGWLYHAGQAILTDRQAAVMAHFGIKAFMNTHFMIWGNIFFLILTSLESCWLQKSVYLQYNSLGPWMMGQMNCRTSVWCSKYYFFHDFLQNSLQKSFQFIFLFFYKITKIKIKEFWVP